MRHYALGKTSQFRTTALLIGSGLALSGIPDLLGWSTGRVLEKLDPKQFLPSALQNKAGPVTLGLGILAGTAISKLHDTKIQDALENHELMLAEQIWGELLSDVTKYNKKLHEIHEQRKPVDLTPGQIKEIRKSVQSINNSLLWLDRRMLKKFNKNPVLWNKVMNNVKDKLRKQHQGKKAPIASLIERYPDSKYKPISFWQALHAHFRENPARAKRYAQDLAISLSSLTPASELRFWQAVKTKSTAISNQAKKIPEQSKRALEKTYLRFRYPRSTDLDLDGIVRAREHKTIRLSLIGEMIMNSMGRRHQSDLKQLEPVK